MTEPLPSAHLFTSAELPQRALSAAEQVDHLLSRRGEVDHGGLELNTIIELNPEAMATAMERDAEARDGGIRGPLHGLAIAVKDNIDTADAMLTTAGSLALADTRPSQDAPLVARLREAGIVVLGKANLSEWANMRSPHSTSGWSARGGLTRNPWDPTRSAGGSSSGSAAAVSAGVAPLAIGTETDGSIICPASYNGVVGIKPTVGLLPTGGIIPISHSQDAPGPMARSVRLVAALLDAMAGTDHYLAACDDVLSGVRVGVVRDHFGAHAAADSVAESAVSLLASAGATIVDDVRAVSFPDPPSEDEDEYLKVLLYEFQHDLTAYLATRPPGSPRTLAEVVEVNRAHADTELQWFGQEYLERAAELPGLDAGEYRTARANTLRMAREDGLDASFSGAGVDVLVAPAFPPAAMNDLVLGDPAGPGGDCTTAPAIAGYPIISVPIGFVHGLPVGLAISGPAGSEALLLRVARTLEARHGLLDDGALVPPL
ncbi:MAG: amidase [Actinomycetia bacterium]|nr:amidase [Actinomycetes bacterium]